MVARDPVHQRAIPWKSGKLWKLAVKMSTKFEQNMSFLKNFQNFLSKCLEKVEFGMSLDLSKCFFRIANLQVPSCNPAMLPCKEVYITSIQALQTAVILAKESQQIIFTCQIHGSRCLSFDSFDAVQSCICFHQFSCVSISGVVRSRYLQKSIWQILATL